MPQVEREIDIRADIEQVQAVIVDFARYPEFVPYMERVEILGCEGDRQRARFTLNLVTRIRYTLDLVALPGGGLDWSLVDGPFKRNEGGWRLEDLGDGATRATYFVDVALSRFLPGFVERQLIAQSLPATLRAFRQRAESLGAMRTTPR